MPAAGRPGSCREARARAAETKFKTLLTKLPPNCGISTASATTRTMPSMMESGTVSKSAPKISATGSARAKNTSGSKPKNNKEKATKRHKRHKIHVRLLVLFVPLCGYLPSPGINDGKTQGYVTWRRL